MTNSNDYICTSNFELRQLPLTTDFDEGGSQSWMEKGKVGGEEDGDWKVEGEKRGERNGVYSLVCSIILSLYLLS